MRTVGAGLAFLLADHGVDTVFGVPGVHNLELYRGLDEAGMTHILARHEQGAGFMADGYARASGKPGVALVISGPGLCNIMTPLGQAYSDSVPLLAISSALPRGARAQMQLHQMKDQVGAGATVCDWSEEALTAGEAFALVDRAMSEFASDRRRSKHIQVPLDLLAEMAETPKGALARSERRPLPDISDLVQALADAERPLFILGGGAKSADALSLIDRIGAAVFETYAGKGIIPFDHSRNFGAYLARPGSVSQIGRADVVVVLGSELAEVDLWREDLGAKGQVFVVDTDPEAHPLNDNAIMIDGDCAGVVDALLAAVEQKNGAWSEDAIAAAKSVFRTDVDQERPGIVPIAEALMAALPANVRIASDMTQFAYVAKEVAPLARPGHWLHPTGFGTLGYAMPAAIGAKVAVGDEPVLAIAGDYGFQYTLPELAVAVELELSLPILIWDNTELKEITASMQAVQMPPTGTRLRNPDFVGLASAFGCASAVPQGIDELISAVHTGFTAGRPTLIRATPDILS